MFENTISFIKELYGKDNISLHEPVFEGNELQYVSDCIKSTFVSSVGAYVNSFEKIVCDYTGAKFAIATTNGTSALHLALVALGVTKDDEVITQNITFIATVNAISYCFATPIIIDCDQDNLALSPSKLLDFLKANAEIKGDYCFNKKTGRKIKVCVPMHVFGHPAKMDELKVICQEWKIKLLEDAAESLGSFYKGKHTGILGVVGTLSFNGNKVVTCGGGGMVLTNDPDIAKHLKHLSTTARVSHQWEFIHDEVGYNYRLPNLNAALGVAQMEKLPEFIENKRRTAEKYREHFKQTSFSFWNEDKDSQANFWLNAIICKNREERDAFLAESNSQGVMTRPLWSLVSELKIYEHSIFGDVSNSVFFKERLVNIPSGVRKTP